jgi:hypothetical protein
MPSKVYVCDACGFSDISKTRFETHCQRMKHKKNILPELARQLDNIKMERLEMKTNLKKEELEKDLELKQKAMELKEQVKEDLEKSAENCITKADMEKSVGMRKFQEKLVGMFDLVEDYFNIYNGVISFQDVFKRDFTSLYEEDKVCVIDKGQVNKGYYMNDYPSYWPFDIHDKHQNGLTRILKCIPLYHQNLRENAKVNDFKVDGFILSQADKKELEEWITQEITIFHQS